MARLGDICEIVSGTTPKSSVSEYWGGSVDWITPAELNEDIYYVTESVRKITEKAVKETSLKSFPAGTVILSSRAPIGKVAIAGKEMYCNQGFKNLICSDRIENRYLFWFLKCNTEYLNSLGRGATFKEISKNIVADIDIPLPSLQTQGMIADKFDRIRKLIADRKTQLDELDQLVKSQFIEMFGDPVFNPFGFEQSTLKNISKIKLSYGSGAAAVPYDGETRYVRITDITDNGSLNDDLKSPASVDEKYLLNDGDILFARTGATVGKTFEYKKEHGRCIYAGFLIRLVPDTTKVLPSYVYAFTQSAYYKKFVAETQRVVAQPNINAQEYGDLTICVPPLDKQREFEKLVQQADKSKFEIQQSIEKLETLKKSLMQQYFG